MCHCQRHKVLSVVQQMLLCYIYDTSYNANFRKVIANNLHSFNTLQTLAAIKQNNILG